MRLSNTPSVALSLLLAGSAFAKYESCSLLGPDVPIPKAVSQSSAFKDALVSLKKAISDAIGTGKTAYGNLDASETSFSLDIFSVHEEDALFTYHYDAPELPDPKEGVKKLDSNSIYRLGSISKLLTMQIFLATVGDISFNEPITKYIPELAAFATQHAADDDIDFMDWDSVTIGALASQLGGIPRDIAGSPESDARAIDDLPDGVPAPIFSPLPENITDAECPNFDAVPCTRAGVLGSINVQHPAFAPSWGPAYSNVAYTLLQYALEDMSKQSFPDLFASKFIKPLQLKDTYYSNAPISQGIVPYNDTEAQYTNDLMALSPGGGFYSTTNDMRAIGKAILNSTLLSPAQTRRWMKPLTFTANDAVLVGAPWEILKAPLPERATWMYTKGGDIGVYSTQIILLPDYGIGFNILAAGDKAKEVNPIIADFVAAIGIPAFEQAAKEEAGNVYAGTYTRPGSNDTLVLAVDKNPGLLVSRFLINGTDVVTSFGGEGKQLRVVPSGLHGGKGKRQGFRVVLAQKPSPEGAFVNTCTDWYIVSADVIAGVSLDDIVITLNADGDKAVEVNARGYRVAYSRS
ncbi:beta-lactamase [Nannizzia gypsea CBS 118893]|uniref:Beta-lactamase n=1 Tax=Arthroderma gypseum (strain ATCC MYA-4604 / CBS 118893) TaxID=535722 RepID=E4V314_ARTGP|nr:beta-lactamase [Nannizzia gypsea CBS 118893]EFR04388.1 beta-lactamase [Nannizzia gypsea CBS 118893]